MTTPVHTWVAEKTGLLENLNPVTLREWQLERVKELVGFARSRTRFYAGIPDFGGDIASLPFTNPADIAADPMAFLAIPPSEVERITTLTTSGTTGAKKRIFFSAGDLERIREYFAVGMRSLTRDGMHAQILISDETVNSLGWLLREALARIGVSSRILFPVPDKETALEAARGADCLVGMPAEILYLCRTDSSFRPESILLTADYVPESVIRAIRETWKCDVFTHYGMTELGFGYAVDCSHHEGHHTRDADILAEIIDPLTGKPCERGKPGEIVLTMFSNEAMPLIRYRTGDLSHFIDHPCPCGSTLKKLGRIWSRFEDKITFPEGELLDIRLLDEVLFAIPAVRGFQASFIREKSSDHLHLIIDSSEKIDPKALSPSVPPKVNLHMHYRTCDPFFHRGKRRLFRDLSHQVFTDL